MKVKGKGKQVKVLDFDNKDTKKARLYVGCEDIPLCLSRFLVQVAQGCFDQPLASLTISSLSLDFREKWRVVTTEVCAFQVMALIDTFKEEHDKFAELQQEHPILSMALMAKTVLVAFLLCRYFGMELRPEIETALCRRMVRRAVRRGAAEHLDRLQISDWHEKGCIFSWFWRHAMPPHHVAWTIPGDMMVVPKSV
jgi:hypothetical protein